MEKNQGFPYPESLVKRIDEQVTPQVTPQFFTPVNS